MVVTAAAFLERDEILIVQRLLARPADHSRIALVELESNPAAYMLLAPVDCRLKHFALRREPEAVVDQARVTRHQLVLEVHGTAVERDALDPAMRGKQDRPARRFIDAARLHPDEAIFDQVK